MIWRWHFPTPQEDQVHLSSGSIQMKYCWEARLFLHTLRKALAFIWVVFKASLKPHKCSKELLVFKRFSCRRWREFWSRALATHSPAQLLNWMETFASWFCGCGQIQQRPLLQISRPWYNTHTSLCELYPLFEEVWLVITWLGTLQCAPPGWTWDQYLGRNGCSWIQSSSHC